MKKLRINEMFIVTDSAEKELMRMADNQTQIRSIAKFIRMVENEEITADNFYDMISKHFTKNVRSERSMAFWDSFADRAYEVLFGDSADEYIKLGKYQSKKYASNIVLRSGDIFYLHKTGNVKRPFNNPYPYDNYYFMSTDYRGQRIHSKCNDSIFTVYDDCVYQLTSNDSMYWARNHSEDEVIMDIENSEPVGEVIAETEDGYECEWL